MGAELRLDWRRAQVMKTVNKMKLEARRWEDNPNLPQKPGARTQLCHTLGGKMLWSVGHMHESMRTTRQKPGQTEEVTNPSRDDQPLIERPKGT